MPHAVDDASSRYVPPVPLTDQEVKEWSNKLIGKKLGETADANTFAMSDLPPNRRIIRYRSGITSELVFSRLNICLGGDGTIQRYPPKPQTRLLHRTTTAIMPLVAPGITGDVVPQTQDWTNRLMGKTIGDESNATTFAMSELPENTRIIPEGQATTMDFQENRLNVHLAKDGTVRQVNQG
ncbi:hypothetical protein O988_07440 [Pseudogymnoascus sp. VKM F-3808]|nr:hypothetical protein O988_07440 [Pseudogymnoascus sp. VKM F-3808]